MFVKSSHFARGLAAFALALTFSAAPRVTHAAEASWVSVGAGCVPTGQTSQAQIHFNTAGRTTFRADRVGEIILTCPITSPIAVAGEATILRVLYRDPDGNSTGSHVAVALRRMNKLTGEVTTIAEFDSNTRMASTFGAASELVGECFEPQFDPDTFYYYVQVNMTRTSTTLPVSIGAIAIESTPC